MRKIDMFRENGRINLDVAEKFGSVKKGKPHIEGAREKFWCESQEEDFLYKKIIQVTYEDFAEIIASEIANMIGLPCAEYDFATSEGKNGVISFDFVGENEELISGKEIMEEVNKVHILPIRNVCNKYIEFTNKINLENSEISKKAILNNLFEIYNESILRTKTLDQLFDYFESNKVSEEAMDFLIKNIKEYFEELCILYEYDFEEWNKKKQVYVSNNLMDIWNLLDIYCKTNGFHIAKDQNPMLNLSKMLLYDIILNQGDRHLSNWSILRNTVTNEIRLAPIYDNSNICKLCEEKTKIKQKSSAIFAFNNNNMSDKKRESSRANISNQLNSQIESKLMVDFNDTIEKNNRFEMLKKLFEISSEEVTDFAINMMNQLSFENIIQLFESIEKKYCIEIPDDVKRVTLKVIELNVNQINTILGLEEKSYGIY